MKIRIGVALNIHSTTNTCISLNCSTAAYFISIALGSIIFTTSYSIVCKSMWPAPLMPHFVRYVIYVKRITYGRISARDTTCFTYATRRIEVSDTAAACTKNVSNIIICSTNMGITSCLVFTEHYTSVTVRIRIGTCGIICCTCWSRRPCGINYFPVVRYKIHTQCKIAFINTIHTVHSCYHCCLCGGNCSSVKS